MKNFSIETREILQKFQRLQKNQTGRQERRFFPLPGAKNFVTRAEKNEYGDMVVSGYAAKFNSLSEDICGMFKEILLPGCFSHALSRADLDCKALLNHDPSHLLGRNGNDSLKLRQDDKGLWFELTLPDTNSGRDTYELVRRGDLNQCSFGFYLGSEDDEYFKIVSGQEIRYIKAIAELIDISIVTFPAYKETSVGVARSSCRSKYIEFHETRNQRRKAKWRKGRKQVAGVTGIKSTVRYDSFNGIHTMFNYSKKRNLSELDKAIFAAKLPKKALRTQIGDSKVKGLSDFRFQLFKAKYVYEPPAGTMSKRVIRSLTEAYYWQQQGVLDDRGLKMIVRQLPDTRPKAGGVSAEFREFSVKVFYVRNGMSGAWNQKIEMKKKLAEMKKNGVDHPAAPWEVAPQFWKMTPVRKNHKSLSFLPRRPLPELAKGGEHSQRSV